MKKREEHREMDNDWKEREGRTQGNGKERKEADGKMEDE